MTETIGLHANLMVVQQKGVLITGPHGIGKSLLSLGLLDRGHRLVCDDVVDVTSDNQVLIGRCPPAIQQHLFLPPLGLLNIATLFGIDSVLEAHVIHLWVELCDAARMPATIDPRKPLYQMDTLANLPIPHLFFPATPPHILPLLIETGVRYFYYATEKIENY